ncbi:MAG: serine hydrolase [Cytophagaceae bacterium]|nr:serine hydrolase [Cytophagaceae bacterium]MDW8456276.1 glycoside hydrolase family 3 N-terminal domain-containing protein [Cytophagaceae bacterium]
MTSKTSLFISLAAFLVIVAWTPNTSNVRKKIQNEQEWVDSVFNSLTHEQRLGQLFMVAAYSNRGEQHVREIENLIRNYHIGGLIFFQGGPVRQAILTNRYQALSKVPLMIGMDAEWGLAMRLDSTLAFPKQMTLGAIQNDTLIEKMGAEIGRQCRRLGVHINFAPVADINNNPHNPVIGIRSFGEDKYNVTNKALAYMRGLQQQRVLANAKHFPGHGDTENDSHHSLPIIKHSKERLYDIELYPFRQMIKDSLRSIMVAHLHVPAYDNTENTASTLSYKIVTDLLKNELQYQGLVFTDALNMKGVSNYYKPGEVDVRALLAGNDVLLYSEDVGTAIEKINKAIRKGELKEEDVYTRVKKILHAKYWLGLNSYKPVEIKNLTEDLNRPKAKALQHALYAAAITVVQNKNNLLPFRHPDTMRLATLTIGADSTNIFHTITDRYRHCAKFAIDKNADEKTFSTLLEKLKTYQVVLVGIHNTNSYNTRHFGISENSKKFLLKLKTQNIVVLSVFGSPYSLKFFADYPYLICAYEDNEYTNSLVPQVVFGGCVANGKLPITASAKLPVGKGLSIGHDVKRLGYTLPENVRMDSRLLAYIDSIAYKMISEKAAPGCQVLVAKDGKIIFDKNYGYLTYENNEPVTSNTIYDLASITKVAATLQAFMFLEERGYIDLDKKASYYLKDLKNTDKENITLREILTHQAGLRPFLAHWVKTIDSSGYKSTYYSTTKSDQYPNEVIPGLYSVAGIEDTLWKWTVSASLMQRPVSTSKKARKKTATLPYQYVYSDIGFYIIKRIVENILNQPMEDFLQDNFYTPLCLQTMMFRPAEKVNILQIAPTEHDKTFRKAIIRGNVHDQGAALMGGVGGHAGLFSNAYDLAVLMQMNLQNGFYGALQFFNRETIPRFASQQYSTNRRGLGWDKPAHAGRGPTSYYASTNTFGHTGFTGTCTWVDPDYNLVYVFLSNRIHTDSGNDKLTRLGIRTSIHDVIYKSIFNYKE